MTARGIKNNNPGNIRKGKDQWQGMALDQSGDSAFVVFDGPQWGVRAMVKILLNYQRDGLDTIAKMIHRWAPAEDSNDPAAYAGIVARGVGVSVNAPVDVREYQIVAPMVRAMIKVECAGYEYPAAVIDEGLRLAGVLVPAPNAAPAPLPGRGSPAVPPAVAGPAPERERAAPWWAALLASILRALGWKG